MGLPVSRNEGKRTGEEAALGRRRGGGVGWGGGAFVGWKEEIEGWGRGVMLRRVRKGRLGLPVECGLSASPERTEQERGKKVKRGWRPVLPHHRGERWREGKEGKQWAELQSERRARWKSESAVESVWQFVEVPGVDVKWCIAEEKCKQDKS